VNESVRVRFAPSPTGYLHVGGARTALFNWLYARKLQGAFILRIEDTDVERSSEDMSRGILEALTWLDLNWDEGPFYQSRRLDLYRTAAERLVESGHAYFCLCPAGAHERSCRDRGLKAADGGAVRFKVPDGAVAFKDEVFGNISVESSTIEDFVLLRSGGNPTYHLTVVVDDIDMRISHVVRGADHISNTPKQILLYQALGAHVPAFVHLPLILGPDKTRLSKRHGATSVAFYQEQGIVPEAFINFFALLGWAPGTDEELFDREELIKRFSLEGISRANAVFNNDKLMWFNAQYIARLPHGRLLAYLKPLFQQAGLWREEFEQEKRDWFRSLVDLLRPRAKVLPDFVRQSRMFIHPVVEYDPAAVEKFLKDPKVVENLRLLADRLEGLPRFDLENTEACVRGLAEELGVKAGVLLNASRVAVTGQAVAPGMFDVMMLVGQEATVARLRAAPTSR
jgi:glutamyl-tRNA synthetase